MMTMRRGTALILVALLSLSVASGAEQQQIISHIVRQPVHSHALAAIGYSKRLRALEIEFVNGAIYRYTSVPQQIYQDLLDAPSKAQFYDANVRGHFPSVHVKRRS